MRNTMRGAAILSLALLMAGGAKADPRWRHLSSATGDLPVPGTSTQQTGAVVADLDKDGVNDFVLSFRQTAPALVWYRPRKGGGWDRSVIEPEFLTVEAGGAVLDIDGDGYPDLVFGGDWQSSDVWWWRNPGPPYRPNVPWERHVIKTGGATQQHDQIFGDFKGTGKPQLAFWNQGAKKLFVADIPKDPRHAESWPATEVFSGSAGEGGGPYAEGLAADDMDGDGRIDLLAGNYWFKYVGGAFRGTKIAELGGRVAAAKLIKGSKIPQVVISSGDGIGPLRWYECVGDPAKTESWKMRELPPKMIHGHSLQIADIDGDGNLDIFTAEMAKWTESRPDPDNPRAKAWIFYGDGKGGFRKTVFSSGIGFHEAKVADLNGDGRMDLLDKPYNWEAPRVDVWLRRAPKDVDDPKSAPMAGLELYSLRAEMSKSLPDGLMEVRRMGFRDTEVPDLYGQTAADLRADLDMEGLTCSAVVEPYERFSGDMEGVIGDAKALGASYVAIGWIPHNGSFGAEDARKAAQDFNRWGEALAKRGLKLCYHPHGYEFGRDGAGTVFDVMARETNPKAVNFELDVFWAAIAGQDPVQLMKKYPTRFPLIHLKDLRKGTAVGDLSGGAPPETSVSIGSGMLDFPAILREARKIGAKHLYIEDEATDAAKQIPESLRRLSRLKRFP